MSKVLELFGISTSSKEKTDWQKILIEQPCPYLKRKCLKVRKSEPEIAIGSCSVLHGKGKKSIIICPYRLLERRQIFMDCFHHLHLHEPGNELHVIPEITVPGGSVDYFLVSVRNDKVRDFLGIELQTLDTTGTIWPERQRFLQQQGVPVYTADADSSKSFGMNWKMTAKTILVQLHHKIQTFENINKYLVLVVQDHFLTYMRKAFRFEHLNKAQVSDPMHIHSYELKQTGGGYLRLELASRFSTDTKGIEISLGLQAEANVELGEIVKQLEAKLSPETLLTI
jgi:hypothetical protein